VRRYEAIIYREGAVTAGMIEQVLGPEWPIHVHRAERLNAPPESLPSPGLGIRHYAPRARLLLVDVTQKTVARSHIPLEQSLVELIDMQAAQSQIVGVLLPDHCNASCADHIFRWGPWHQPEILAQRLYSGLRQLDDLGCTVIIAPMPESSGIADAIRDRLEKAAC
jgi:L-threonylcarbamoyladenylate synthase